MGGSTGTVSKVMAPTSGYQEKQKSIEQSMMAQPGLQQGLRSVYGKITKVHDTKAMVKAIEINTNTPVANDNWIVLNHSVREIAERWGKIRKGQIVYVQYRGPDGASATGNIVKEQGEELDEEPLVENTMSRGLFRIFGPGCGFG